MKNFSPKPWSNPFGEMKLFPLFKIDVFLPKEPFFIKIIVKHIFLTFLFLFCREQKIGKFSNF